MTADEIISYLSLAPHPEGGYYRETYRSAETIAAEGLPARYGSGRCFGTSIYFLVTAGSFSAMHRLESDEVYHFYLGDPVFLLLLYPDGSGEIKTLGGGLIEGHVPQFTVPRGTWQGLMPVDGGQYALLGTTVAPGFDFDDFEWGTRSELTAQYPTFSALIERLTRK